MQTSINDSTRTLWIGDLENGMDQFFLKSIIVSLGYEKQLINIKLIKDKTTGVPLKYGFLEFNNCHSANNFYQNYNQRTIPNTSKQFKLNWAVHNTFNTKMTNILSRNGNQQTQIYVGDFDTSITEHKLLQLFKQKYSSAFMSKIITDPSTKISKGYGFVKFTNSEQAQMAIHQMNGTDFSGKIIKVSTAHQKSKEQILSEKQEMQKQQLLRQKLYAQFYSSSNDPQMKKQYENQILKLFGNEQSRKATLKQSLQSVRSLSYQQTLKSEELLQIIPKYVSSKEKYLIQTSIYE